MAVMTVNGTYHFIPWPRPPPDKEGVPHKVAEEGGGQGQIYSVSTV